MGVNDDMSLFRMSTSCSKTDVINAQRRAARRPIRSFRAAAPACRCSCWTMYHLFDTAYTISVDTKLWRPSDWTKHRQWFHYKQNKFQEQKETNRKRQAAFRKCRKIHDRWTTKRLRVARLSAQNRRLLSLLWCFDPSFSQHYVQSSPVWVETHFKVLKI